MKIVLSTVVLMILVLSGVSPTYGYEITKLIEVGDATSTPMLGPLKWSPDGTSLAYFVNRSQLMLSDTLGNSRKVKELTQKPHSYEWVTNEIIAMKFSTHLGRLSSDFELITLDVNSLEETAVSEYRYDRDFKNKSGNASFVGPSLTQEGNAYFEIHTTSGDRSIPPGIERVFFEPEKVVDSLENHVVRLVGDTALYLVNFDNLDSSLLIDFPGRWDLWAQLSSDHSYVFTTHYLVNLQNEEVVDLLDYIGDPPPKTRGCGVMYQSFNPLHPEVLFDATCDDGVGYIVDRICTFNYLTNDFVVLDTMLGFQDCSQALYHPSGNMIAFLSNSKLYIVYRGGI